MIRMKLESQGIIMNHKKIIRIMKKYRLFARVRRTNPYKMSLKHSQEHHVCENKLKRAFKQKVPGVALSTDITYIPFKQRFVYLSVVKDLASGEIVGWHLAEHLHMTLVTDTLKHLAENTGKLAGAMIHSDQGTHYTSPLYQRHLKELGMEQSMSRKGNCLDNAPIESFFGHLKDELGYRDCQTFESLLLRMTEYMEYYNHERPQWSRKKMTPVQYRNHLLAEG
jgi:putative transposase